MNTAARTNRTMFAAVTVLAAVLLVLTAAGQASSGSSLKISATTPTNGQTISGSINWQLATGGAVKRVNFLIDGATQWTDYSSPYSFGRDTGSLDTTTLADGKHALKAVGYDRVGRTVSTAVQITVANLQSSLSLAPSLTSAPTVSGTAQVGRTVTASTGTWSGTTPMSYAYRWERCDSAGAGCAAISGATTSNYALTNTDVGSTLRGQVTATNSAGSAMATSAQSPVVAASAPVNTSLPVISGTPQVGLVVSTSDGAWTNSPSSYAYQWQRCDSSGSACVPISGATASTYTLVSGDAGFTLRSSVTATNSTGSASATSPQSALVGSGTSTALPPGTNLGTSLPARMPESSGSALYVSLSGSDSAAGTIASPFRTVVRAFQAATSGTTIYMRGGTWPDYIDVRNLAFPTTNPVTLTKYSGETVVIRGNSPSDPYASNYMQPAMLFLFDSGIRVRGLTFTNPYGTGLKIQDSTHFDVDHNGFANNTNQGLLVSGDSINGNPQTWSSDIQVWNNTFTHNGGLYPSCPYPSGDIRCNNYIAARHDHSIYYGAAGSYGGGIRNGTEDGLIANNVFYDQNNGFSMRIGDAARGLLIVNNTIYHSYVEDPVTNPYWGQGINVTNSSSDGYQTKNVGVYNNIITNSAAATYGSAVTSEPSNTVDYNLSWSISTTQNTDCAPDCNFNARYGAYNLYTPGTHNVKGVDPLFLNATGHDYHLQANSPALGKANPAYAPPYDADGNPRPAAPALGAFG